MTYSSSIHQFLSIENKNITFDHQLFLPPINIKDITYKQLAGTLSYNPVCCEKCGVKNERHTVIKHGCKAVLQVTIIGKRWI